MKRVASAILSLILLFSCLPAALADTGYYNEGYATGEVICMGVSLRTDHKTSAKRIRLLDNGEVFTILEEYDGWYRVNHNGTEGWLLADYVVEEPEHLLTRKGNIPARAWASKSSKRVGLIGAGEKLTVIRELESYWIVSFRNAMCYVSKDASVWSESEAALARPHYSIQIVNETAMRYGPDGSWGKMHVAHPGERYQVVGVEGDWYKVLLNGFYAYAWKPDIKILN